jgi:peptide/nickel transport system permease protein
MFRYLFRRLIRGLIILVVFQAVVFFAVQWLFPGDFTSQFLGMSPEDKQALREELGLDRPLGEQYLRWLGGVLSGDLGDSFRGFAVADTLQFVIPTTLLVMVTGTAISFAIGYELGKANAWRGPGARTNITSLSALMFYTSFPPWIAFLLTYFFARQLRWFDPVNPTLAYDQQVWANSTLALNVVMIDMLLTFIAAILIVMTIRRTLWRRFRRRMSAWVFVPLLTAGALGSWFILGFAPQALNLLHVALLPIIAYVLLTFGETMFIMHTSMNDVLHEQYITLARAKGLPDYLIRDAHAAPNALLPVLSRMVVSLPYILTGVVIIEYAIVWLGVGASLYQALLFQDIPLIMGLFLIIGILSLGARLMLDVLYAFLDPRIRYELQPEQKLK